MPHYLNEERIGEKNCLVIQMRKEQNENRNVLRVRTIRPLVHLDSIQDSW
jgi:hypothetical protein